LGRLYKAYGDTKKAGYCYIEAHKCNPFVWDAFEGLCKVGADLKVERMFQPTWEMAGRHVAISSTENTEVFADDAHVSELSKPLAPQLNFNQQVFTPSADPFDSALKAGPDQGAAFRMHNLRENGGAPGANSKAPLSEWDTPTANSGSAGHDDDTTCRALAATATCTTVRG